MWTGKRVEELAPGDIVYNPLFEANADERDSSTRLAMLIANEELKVLDETFNRLSWVNGTVTLNRPHHNACVLDLRSSVPFRRKEPWRLDCVDQSYISEMLEAAESLGTAAVLTAEEIPLTHIIQSSEELERCCGRYRGS